MKGLGTAALGVGLTALFGLGIAAAVTNPQPSAYEDYATEQLSAYLRDNVCTQAPESFGLRKQCVSLIESNQSEVSQLVAESTQRQNFWVFSLYQTDLAVTPLLPAYHFETVGAFKTFYTYKVEKR